MSRGDKGNNSFSLSRWIKGDRPCLVQGLYWIENAEGVASGTREGLARRPKGESQRSGNWELRIENWFTVYQLIKENNRVVTIGTKDSAFFAQKTDTVYSIQFLQLTVDSLVFENRFLESDIRYQFPKMKNEATAFVVIHYSIIILLLIIYYIIILYNIYYI